MDHFVWFLSTNLPRWLPIPSISNKTETLNRVTLFLSFFGSSCNDTPQSSGADQRYLHRKHRGVHLSWTACWGAEMTDVTWQMCKKMVSWSCHGVTWSQELTCFTTCWLFSAPAEALVLQSPIDRMDRRGTWVGLIFLSLFGDEHQLSSASNIWRLISHTFPMVGCLVRTFTKPFLVRIIVRLSLSIRRLKDLQRWDKMG